MNDEQAVVSWSEELAALAKMAVGMEESTNTLQFFSTKSGVLSWNGVALPDNQMAVVIVDSVLENVYYTEAYDPDKPASPVCFAFGRKDEDMQPHARSSQKQCETCKDCPNNKWKTAEKGKGKACGNIRRLALLAAGSLDTTGAFTPLGEDKLKSDGFGFLKIPVTSVKGFSQYVQQINGAMELPPLGVYTKIKVVPDAKKQFVIKFECLGKVPNELMGTLMGRRKEAASVIETPYTPFEKAEEDEAPKTSKKRKF